ncbi:peptide deformylase [Nostoc sp. 'Peltigera membranacea cyanobiont' 213]|uniref:peptide deformylase n=1 Tax=unclassified Nostoc TaxID=2593658 RepID=UPI000B957F69|nr:MULTISPECIES: peptide deformylase [unclassified Nostoc]AVH64855.1 peptide deformylase [Nostoc sp. 'Peltigera membranacea cyanobiont' N6]OYD90719.1 peptide deformylase [Nostoc sp. 'Peltigera membranacea cyanobiont' 213]OYE02840.1 peptide deformylase [Nostoc sp. 'Peltigera membranacea cyanobiont' 232]
MPSEIAVEKKKLKNPPLELHYLGDRVLRQTAKRISKVDNELRQMVREMLQTMYSKDGIGLAAPQVGIHKQLIVIDLEPENAANLPLVLINPTIKQVSREISVAQEGCLSIPNVYLDVKRPEVVEIAYKDEYGRPRTLKANDLLGRCIQHEMDHLNGVVFVDRVENSLTLAQELSKNGFSYQAVKPIA